MNARKLLVSISFIMCMVLVACTPAILTPTTTSYHATTTTTATHVIATNIPTVIPATKMPASDPDSLTKISGTYAYKVASDDFHILLRSDGTFAYVGGSGNYLVTPDQITLVDTLPASGSSCGSKTGVYTWSLDGNALSLVPVKDDCNQRAKLLGSNKFEKVQDDPNAPVEFVWRIDGSPNQLYRPWPIAVDAQSNLYVIDGANQRIQKFDSNGNFLATLGSYGTEDGQFIFFTGGHFGSVAIDQAGNLYVTDHTQRIQKFDESGNFLLKWGTLGKEAGEFGDTTLGSLQVAVDNQSNVYVLDPTNYRIEKFEGNGKFLMQWGSRGTGESQFGDAANGPGYLVIDDQNNIYVSDDIHNRIEKFDTNGKFLGEVTYGKGSDDGQVLNLAGFAVDQQGNLYIADNQQNVGELSNQFSKFDSHGKFLWKWGDTGGDLGQFLYINSIAVDKQGNIYVASEDIVQKFAPK